MIWSRSVSKRKVLCRKHRVGFRNTPYYFETNCKCFEPRVSRNAGRCFETTGSGSQNITSCFETLRSVLKSTKSFWNQYVLKLTKVFRNSGGFETLCGVLESTRWFQNTRGLFWNHPGVSKHHYCFGTGSFWNSGDGFKTWGVSEHHAVFQNRGAKFEMTACSWKPQPPKTLSR